MGAGGFGEAQGAFRGAAEQALVAGAHNLVEGCAGVQPGQRVLVLREDPALGWYDAEAPSAVARVARELGAEVDVVEVGGPESVVPAALRALQTKADVEIWFARLGDRDRFADRDTNRVSVVSYARTAAALASAFGRHPHADMVALKDTVNGRLLAATLIKVTCPFGTDLEGAPGATPGEEVSVRRFPMSVPRPVPAAGFSGQVALRGYLTPTGSRSYVPAVVELSGTVMAHIEHGRIVDLTGAPETIERVRAQYDRVSAKFGIDRDVVHSWHAGIHDGCWFDGAPAANPDLWSNTVFGSPRWLHFHTCGNYAPGEICWMVENPTVCADGDPVWSDGELVVKRPM